MARATTKKSRQSAAKSAASGPPADFSASILRCENLVKIYNKRTVVEGVSFEIRQREIVGLLGPNGAGKTTSFYMAVGLVKADSGQVYINHQDVTSLPMYKRARLGVGYLAQEASVFRKLTVAENLEAVLEMHFKDRKEIERRRDALIDELHLNRVVNQNGFTLSGGERRRCEIARALATEPDFILLDEPFAGVDPIAVKDIQDLISQLRERGLGILITDHNVRETLKITDRSYIMYAGQILRAGQPGELVNDPEIRRKYLGEDFKL
ncbi:MAG: LPS export ABC transporter ATP-binding protein [Leptospiraceae bacterium]|nr:LPS export ABC transporter ATP-binding protein [Leptospiraceae bacterium]